MAQSLSEQDLYELISAKSHLKPETVEKVWSLMKEIITSELQNNGSINLRNFGTFKTVKKGGDDEWVLNSFGLQEKKYIEPYDFVAFEPSKNYISLVNSGYTKPPITKKALIKFKETETVDESEIAYEIATDPSVLEIVDGIFKGKYKRKSTKRPNMEVKNHLPYMGKKIKCLDNNTVYNSILEMSKYIPVPYYKLYYNLRNGNMKVSGFTFEWINEHKENEFDKQIREKDLH